MKKISVFVLVLLSLFVCLQTEAALGPTVTQQVDSKNIYDQLQAKRTFTGKKYRDGLYENYFVVETTGVADLRKNWNIYGLTDYYEIYSSTPFTDNRNLIETVPTFVAFDSTDVRDGYAYTLLYGLGLCSDDNTTSKNVTGISFKSAGIVPELWTTSLVRNNSNYTFFNIPSGKTGVQLMLVGDVIVTTVTLKQYRKTWVGDSLVTSRQVNAYICCNTYEVDYYTTA